MQTALKVCKNRALSSLFFLGLSFNLSALEPVGLNMGNGFAFFPSVRFEYEHNSNIYRRHNDEVSSGIFRAIPTFVLVKDTGQTFMQGVYRLDKGIYTANSSNDYLDHLVSFEIDSELNAYHRLDADLSYQMTHDNHGSGLIAGTVSPSRYDLEAYNQFNAELGYGLGSLESSISSRFYVKHYGKIYKDLNIPSIESRNHYKNLVGTNIRLSPGERLGAAADIEYTQIRYYENMDFGSRREGSNIRLQLGLEWEFSSFTTGELKLGAAKRSFSKADFDSTKFRPVWEIEVEWEPLEYTKLTVTTGSENTESAEIGSHIEKDKVKLALEHEFSALFKAELSGEYIANERIQSAAPREKNIKSDTLNLKLKMIYSPFREADIELWVGHESFSSNKPNADYKANYYGLALELAM